MSVRSSKSSSSRCSSRRGASGRRVRPVASAAVAGLAGLPAGPELAAALAGLDLAGLSGFETVLVVRAWHRLNNYTRGMMLAAVGEVMLRKDPEYGRVEPDPEPAGGGGFLPDEVGASELRTALWLTRRSANRLCALAGDLRVRLPQVQQAMISGQLDQARASIFSLWTGELCPRHAQAVVAALLPVAHTLTTAQLIERIQKAAVELDPGWARRRYRNGLKARDVKGSINLDGTAELAGSSLPADEVAAACDRIDALAHQVKQAGHWWPLRWIRAEIFLGRNSKYVGYTDEQLIAELLATMPPPDDPTTPTPGATSEGTAGPADPRNSAVDDPEDLAGAGRTGDPEGQPEPPDPSGSVGGRAAEPPGHPSDGGDDGPEPHDPSTGGGRGDGPEPPGPSNGGGGGSAGPSDQPSDSGSGGAVPDPAGTRRGVPACGGARRGLRLLAGLATIAGRDQRPADLLGFGMLHADLARQVAAAPHAAWYYALTSADGTPLHIGAIRRRPTTPASPHPTRGASGVEVWLQLTPPELATLSHDPPPGWAAILAAITDRVERGGRGAPTGDPTDRIPSTTLRRWINIRDRRCVFPGCRIAPHRTDADHTRPYATGGPTTAANLGSICSPDHTLRHEHGWSLTQPSPGRFIWTSPLGHTYERTRPPGPETALRPMPDPVAPEDDWFHHYPNTGAEYNGEDTCLTGPPPPRPTQPPQPPPPPAPPPPRNPADDTIPF